MHLWTEYEGRTIAEHYTLGKLLRSEGRNGFFATADKDGHPAVIRLTEAHYDEAEQLRRWRQVAEVHQDNLIEIEQVGQTTFEGVALTYALMEPDDANLGDVLKERPLTTAETLQVAKAVLPALKALHERGLVHEHVEPANVMAVGETVKLRSDCVRECVADGEFTTEEGCADLRKKDLHDYGVLLLRCLTLETEFAPAHNNLPDPFKRVIPKAMDGVWGIEQIGAALDPALFTPRPSAPVQTNSPAGKAGVPSASAQDGRPADLAAAAPDLAPAVGEPATPKRPLVPPGVLQDARQQALAEGTAAAAPYAGVDRGATRVNTRVDEPAVPVRTRYDAGIAEQGSGPSRAIWAVVAIAGVLLLWLAYHFFSGSKTEAPVAGSRPAPVVSSGAPVTPAPPTSAETGVMPSQPAGTVPPAPRAAGEGAAPAAGAPGWYVVAFTYNHEAQAANKVRHLIRIHNSLHPQVFTPTGGAPFYVSLGGPMSTQDQAEAVWRHARRAGLPRDTFVRRY